MTSIENIDVNIRGSIYLNVVERRLVSRVRSYLSLEEPPCCLLNLTTAICREMHYHRTNGGCLAINERKVLFVGGRSRASFVRIGKDLFNGVIYSRGHFMVTAGRGFPFAHENSRRNGNIRYRRARCVLTHVNKYPCKFA